MDEIITKYIRNSWCSLVNGISFLNSWLTTTICISNMRQLTQKPTEPDINSYLGQLSWSTYLYSSIISINALITTYTMAITSRINQYLSMYIYMSEVPRYLLVMLIDFILKRRRENKIRNRIVIRTFMD